MEVRVFTALIAVGVWGAKAQAEDGKVSRSDALGISCQKKPVETQVQEVRRIFEIVAQNQCAIDSNHTGICRDGKLLVSDLKSGVESVVELPAGQSAQDPNVVETFFVKHEAKEAVPLAYQVRKDGRVDQINLTTGEVRSKTLAGASADQIARSQFTGEKSVLSVPGEAEASSRKWNLDELFSDVKKPAFSFTPSLIAPVGVGSENQATPAEPSAIDFSGLTAAAKEPAKLIKIPCSASISEKEKAKLKDRGVDCEDVGASSGLFGTGASLNLFSTLPVQTLSRWMSSAVSAFVNNSGISAFANWSFGSEFRAGGDFFNDGLSEISKNTEPSLVYDPRASEFADESVNQNGQLVAGHEESGQRVDAPKSTETTKAETILDAMNETAAGLAAVIADQFTADTLPELSVIKSKRENLANGSFLESELPFSNLVREKVQTDAKEVSPEIAADFTNLKKTSKSAPEDLGKKTKPHSESEKSEPPQDLKPILAVIPRRKISLVPFDSSTGLLG